MSEGPTNSTETRLLNREAKPVTQKTIGGYKILGELGEGGMGEVFLASDTSLGREVAIKLVRRELVKNSRFLDRFMREARLSASLNHPNIVTIYQVGMDDNVPYLVQEFIEGHTLQQRMRTPPPLTTGEIIEYALQLCDGLNAAASKRIIHRDLKPPNIMIRKDGLLKIMDFGLSKQMDSDSMTMTSAILGTPDYMAPEQAAGRQIDFRADIYSLGITLFHCFTGYLPFKSSSVFETIRLHAEDPLPDDPDLMNLAGGKVHDLIVWMTAKDPRDRPDKYSQIKSRLEDIRTRLSTKELSRIIEPKPEQDPAKAELYAATIPDSPKRPSSPVKATSKQGRLSKSKPKGYFLISTIFLLVLAGAIFYGVQNDFFGQSRNSSAPVDSPRTSTDAPTEIQQASLASASESSGYTARSVGGKIDNASNLLSQIAAFGINIQIEGDLKASAIPLMYSFEERTPEEMLECLVLAVGWSSTREDSHFYLTPGSMNPYEKLQANRRALDPESYPRVSINLISRDMMIGTICDGLSKREGLSFLVVGSDLCTEEVSGFSRTDQPLNDIIELLRARSKIPFEWTYIDKTLILVQGAPSQ